MHRPWLDAYPNNIKWDQDISVRPVHYLLEDTVHQYGEKPAFDFLGKKWNWAEISDVVDRMARGLQQEGIGKGKQVGLFLPNCPYFLISYYAVLRTGATVVNFNPLYAERELSYQIEDAEVDLMITLDLAMLYNKMQKMLHDTRLDRLVICSFTDILPFPKNKLFKMLKGKDLAKITPSKRLLYFNDLIDNEGNPDSPDIDPENDIAVLQYTGGTTGVPKGAMLTHANVTANVEQCALWLNKAQPGEEKMLGILPFFHVFAMTAVMNFSVRNAFEIIALPRFELKPTLKLISKQKPHYFPAVPAIYGAINNFPGLKKFDLTSLRYCISGGAPLPVEVKKNFEDLTGCVVVEGYGLTESSPVACVNPLEGENKAGSIGFPLPGTDITLIDPDSGKIVEEIGQRGEICISGPQIMKGYWNKPEETAKVIKDGRLHTGDIGLFDEDGYVYIVDRLKDMIITNGYNVYPRNVEEAIYLHPSVEECIVAGIPDTARGEIVKAWIKLKKDRDVTPEDMKEFLGDKISPMEIPKRFEFRDEPLPKTMIGKLSRKDVLAEEKQ